MNKNKDRVDIINAINEASSNELQALAEIKNAISSHGVKVVQDTSVKGKVSRRLADRNVVPEASPRVVYENPYVNTRKNASRQNIAPQRSIAINRHQLATAHPAQNSVAKIREPESLKPDTGRDSKGRFVSKSKNAEIKQQQYDQSKQKADAKLQTGFFRKLSSIMGVDRANGGDSDALTDAAGVGAGGPIWLAAKGSFDVAKEATNKVSILKNWLTKGDKSTDENARGEPAPKRTLSYPGAEAKPAAAPVMGKKSHLAFNEKIEAKSVKVVQEQTKTLAENDKQIINGLEDISDEVVKLRKSLGKGDGSGLLGKLRDLLPGSLGGRRSGSRKSPAKKSKGKLGAIGRVLGSAGSKVTAGVAAAATAITGGRLLAGKKNLKNGEALKSAGATPDVEKVKNSPTTTKSQKVTSKASESAGEHANKVKVSNGAVESQKTAQNAVQGAEKAAGEAGEATAVKVAQKAEGKAAGEIATKSAVKTGAKAAAKGALRMVPLVGTALMTAYDAADGYSDSDAQRETFNLKSDQDASTQQKTSYAAANVVDMGGIISGITNLAGKGASALGMDGVGETLQNFNTGTIARGVNNSIDGVKSLFIGATTVADSLVNKAKDAFSSSDESTKQVKKAVEDGAGKTVAAINSLKYQLQGGIDGEDGVGVYGNKSVSEFAAPSNNTIATDLNIGGSNAKNRNFRNNNLGNLVFANQEGASLEAANANGERRFAKFNTPEEGIRGLANQVSSYYNGTSKAAGYEKLQTVSSIIAKWAPPNENNTNQYIKNVCEYLGVSPNQKIDVSDPEVMTHLVRAIATKEGGNPAVNDGFIKNALGAYNQAAGRWEGQFSDESLAKINEVRSANGEHTIARDSQYSAGNKVKFANGVAPVLPAKNSVPLKTPISSAPTAKKPVSAITSAKEPVQHAQAVKKKAQGEGGIKPNAAAASITENDLLAAMQGDESAIAKISAPSADAGTASAGGIMPLAFDMVKSSASMGADFLMSGGIGDAFEKKSRDADKAMAARIEAISGKKIGFHKAAPLAAITDAIQKPAKAQEIAGTPENQSITPPQSSKQDVPVYNNGYRIVGEGEDTGFMGSLLDSSVSGLKKLGAAVLPTAGEHLSRVVGGVSGTGLMDDLVYQATGGNTDVTRAVSPLTRQAGDWLNGGIQQVAGGINAVAGDANNMIFGGQQAMQEPYLSIPTQLHTVTDLARSGIRQPLTSDTANHDPAMLNALENVTSVLKEILNVNKSNGKSSGKGDPDKVVKTSQPEPRQRVSTNINDPSLDALLED